MEGVVEEQSWHEMILLPKEVLRESPSRRLGISEEVETRHRVFGCELIQEAGILLRQPQVVMATAQNLLHRFYYRRALTSENTSKRFYFDAFTVAMGCIFLASKLEEKPRAPRDIIFIFHHICRKRRNLSPTLLEVTSTRYHDLREVLLNMEKYILKELGFGFYNIMDHPHKFILYYIKTLDGDSTLAQKAWNYLNDSLRLDCCVRYRAELIACAAIYMAARDLQVKLPDNPPWWDLFGTELKEVKRVCNAILSLYDQEPVRWIEPLHSNSLVSQEVLEKVEGKKVAIDPSGSSTADSVPSSSQRKENGGEEGQTPTTEAKHGNGLDASGTPMSILSEKASGEPKDDDDDEDDEEGGGGSSQKKAKDRGRGYSPRSSRGRSLSRDRDRKRRKYRSRSRERSLTPPRRQHHHHRHRDRDRDRRRDRYNSRKDKSRRGDDRSRDRRGSRGGGGGGRRDRSRERERLDRDLDSYRGEKR